MLLDTVFSYVLWNVDPVIFEVFGRGLRWYGLLFGVGLYLAVLLSYGMLKKTLLPATATLDKLFLHVFLGTVIGARLGHVLFYDPIFYFSHPVEILFIHKGGLASHGGILGVIFSLWLFARKHKIPFLALLDYTSVAMPLAFFFIRMANLANSEIYGHPTDLPHGFVFSQRASEHFKESFHALSVSFTDTSVLPRISGVPLRIDMQMASNIAENRLQEYANERLPMVFARRSVRRHMTYPDPPPPITTYYKDGKNYVRAYAYGTPRHPTQLYEGIGYLLLFMLFYSWWRRHQAFAKQAGLAFSVALMLGSLVRFVVEFWKVPQEAFVHALPLNMGQLLSLPFFLMGLYLFLRLRRNGPSGRLFYC